METLLSPPPVIKFMGMVADEVGILARIPGVVGSSIQTLKIGGSRVGLTVGGEEPEKITLVGGGM